LSQVAGLDEAGRGPLAGPVVASALLLNRFQFPVRIDDSKRLSPSAREAAYRAILPYAQIGVGFVGPEEIDQVGIHRATALAMRQALERLPVLPALVLIDGISVPPGFPIPAMPIIHGDSRSLLIACASIVAKVIRDRWMLRIHRLVPEYGFHRHKGYGTAEHLEALRLIGPSLFHRFSFSPVHE
jgi:ribonuclease HII